MYSHFQSCKQLAKVAFCEHRETLSVVAGEGVMNKALWCLMFLLFAFCCACNTEERYKEAVQEHLLLNKIFDQEYDKYNQEKETKKKTEEPVGSNFIVPPPPPIRRLYKAMTPVEQAGAPTPTDKKFLVKKQIPDPHMPFAKTVAPVVSMSAKSVQSLLEEDRSLGCSGTEEVWKLDLCTQSQFSVLAKQIDQLKKRVDQLEARSTLKIKKKH